MRNIWPTIIRRNHNQVRSLAMCGALWATLFLNVNTTVLFASSLSPSGTRVEQQIAQQNNDWWQKTVMALGSEGALIFAEPVHEEITARAFNCQNGCNDIAAAVEWSGPYVIAGVRWNDDPPFQLQGDQAKRTSCITNQTIRFTTQPRCWYQLFTAARAAAAKGDVPDAASHSSLLARSHFGDLQFFHSMASRDGEVAAETQRRVLMWMEFTWRVAMGEYTLSSKLSEVSVPGFDDYFGRSGWTVQDLFTAGNPALRPHIAEVALGSFLHTVEDSFAEGHVERSNLPPGACVGAPQFVAPSEIIEFHSYAHQDERKHKAADTRTAFFAQLTNPTNVVSVV